MTKTVYENGVTFVIFLAVGFIAFCLGLAMGYREGVSDTDAVCESIMKNHENKNNELQDWVNQ